jgi:arginine deiminase
MNKEELMKKTKEELVKMLIDFMKTNDTLLADNKELREENERRKIDTYIYNEFLSLKEMYEHERQANIQNGITINELNELLNRYKNIVDRLGGRYE